MTAHIIQGNALCLPLPDESVDCIVTSPPYNVGLEYEDVSDKLTPEEYEALAYGSAAEMYRTLRPDRRAWVNITPAIPIEPIPAGWHSGRGKNPRMLLLTLWAHALEAAGFFPWDIICWPTSGRGPGTAWGSWQSPASPNLRGEWEAILLYYKGCWSRETPAKWKHWKDSSSEWTSLVSNVWKMQPERRNGHPAPFPSQLAGRAMRLSTWPGDVVLDPFVGSGTTVKVAKDLGRVGVGVDLSGRYVEMARRRCAQEVLAL